MNSIGYLVKQGLRNTLRNGVMSLASIGVLFSCLLLVGISVLLSLNLNNVISGIEHQNEIKVFLVGDINEEQINKINDILTSFNFIDTFEFVNKEKALERYLKSIGNDQLLFEDLKNDNPLPDTYNVVLSDLSRIDELISKLESNENVEKVNAPIELAKMIVSIKHAINTAGIVIIFILFLVSLVIISNTIKLTIYNRRKEINIMKFVGASDIFIKLPFLVEGVSIGVISAILAHLTLWFSYNYLISKMATIELQWVVNLSNNVVLFSEYSIYILFGFLSIGFFIGMIGSSLFVRKYLRV